MISGGWLFTSTGADRVRNPGIVIRGGKFMRVGGDVSIAAPNAERIAIADTDYSHSSSARTFTGCGHRPSG